MQDRTSTRLTSPPGARERRKQQFRERIMQAAINLFDAHGFEAVTLEQICEAAGVSRPTFYSYYKTKQDLIQALGEQVWLQVTGEFAQQSLAQAKSTEAFVRAFFRLVGKEITDYTRLEKALVQRSMGSDSAVRMTVLARLTEMFQRVYEQGQARGEIGSPQPVDFLAEMTMGGVNAVMMNWATRADYPLQSRLQQLADQVCHMLQLVPAPTAGQAGARYKSRTK